MISRLNRWLFIVTAACVLFVAGRAKAAPEVHILRIDPRAGLSNGAPLLTTVVEAVQFNSYSDVFLPCANVIGAGPSLDCISAQTEKPNAVRSGFAFPEAGARLLVKVGGADTLASMEGKPVSWKDSKDPGVGTAWLVALDASSGMGARYGEARAITRQFIEAMGPGDQMDLEIFDDRGVIQNSKWKTFKQRNDLVAVLNAQAGTAPSHGSAKPLFNELKGITADGFGTIGNTQGPEDIPLHQAMIVLSNGSGRDDASSAAPSATIFRDFVTKGRFPDDNPSIPKTPLPVISIWLPTGPGLVNDALRNNDEQFMRDLSNPEIGGFFDVVREGQGEAKGKTIIKLVKQRFDSMFIVKWRLSCLDPQVTQTFDLQVVGTKPQMKGDATFKDVPIGVDPSQWPLDIDVAKSKAEAEANPVHPGGEMKIYGNFCWGSDSKRAEAYFVPAGTKPDPNFNSNDLQAIQKARQNLIAQDMRGAATDANGAFATFKVPDEDAVLDGTGDNAVVHVLVVDQGANRASGHDERTILTLKGGKKPFNAILIAGIAGGVLVVVLLLLVLLRGGGGGRGGRKSRGAPPAPVVAGGGYPGAPGPGGHPHQPGPGGGFAPAPQPGAQLSPPPPPQALAAPYAPPAGPSPAPYAPSPAPYAAPAFGASPEPMMQAQVVQVRCPSCGSMTMTTPGQPSVCFSCGQPLPANIAGGAPGDAALFPLTGALPARLTPPPNPYASNGGSGGAPAAVISGAAGNFSIPAGSEVRVGRDPAQCPVTLSEPRVSGVHSTLKFEASQLWVRDETSNNGTYVAGSRISPGTWVPVPPGAQLRFGPVEFTVRLDA